MRFCLSMNGLMVIKLTSNNKNTKTKNRNGCNLYVLTVHQYTIQYSVMLKQFNKKLVAKIIIISKYMWKILLLT